MTFSTASILAPIMLVVLAAIGQGNVAVAYPTESVAAIGCSGQVAIDAPGSLHDHDGSRPFAEGRFGCDLRQPRRPRHRCERITSVAIDVGLDRITAILSSVDLDRSCQRFVATATLACALAGHPLELLRPPSFVA